MCGRAAEGKILLSFAGNQLVGERAAAVHKIDHSGGQWRGNVLGCASPALVIDL